MKKIQILISALVILLFGLQLSCTKETSNVKPKNDVDRSARIGTKDPGVITNAVSTPSYTCGSTNISDSYYGNGAYTYTSKQLNVSCVAVGATVTVSVNSSQYPNRFVVKDPNGTIVASSNSLVCSNGWMGAASYQGPWSTASSCQYVSSGGGLQAPATGPLTFTKGSFSTYYLEVQASLPPSGNPNGTTNPPQQDSWVAGLSCTCTSGTPCNNSCGKSLSGSYYGNGGYTYATQVIDVTPCPGQTISSVTVSVNSSQYPNQFVVKDPNGTIVASSNSLVCSNGWMGAASYQGPWSTASSCQYVSSGGGLQAPATGPLTFTRNYNIYYLEVRTSLPPSGNPNGTTNPPQQDSWVVGISCR